MTHSHSLAAAVRVILAGLVVTIVALAVAVAVVTAWVVTLRDQRLHQQAEQQRQIDATFCSVLAELPADSLALQHIRAELHCTDLGAPAGGLNP